MRWFYKDWWQYLFAPRTWRSAPWHVVIWCRLRGHPDGPVYYNIGGSEPDYHCINCGDEI